jgi:restriction system protein
MKISFKKAAIKILEINSKPMTASEIAKIAIEEKMIDTEGETPEATMAAQIYVDIKKNKTSPFVKVGKALFALKNLSDTPASPLLIIEKQNELTKSNLKELLHVMDPFQFEYLVADLLREIGYENVMVTKRSGDKGIDVIANLTIGGITSVKTVIQAKRYAPLNKLNGAVITQLRGSAEVDQRGLIITTSDFTKDGIDEAQAPNKMPVSLVNGEKLIQLLIKYGVGVKSESLTVLSLDDSYFQNFSSDDLSTSVSGKNRSIWPLPGGTATYVETLNSFLSEVKKGNNTKKGLVKWYIDGFENVKSEATTQGYISVPKNMGLTKFVNGMYFLTEDGAQYFKSKSKELLYEIISKNILAFGDIYEYLKLSSKPLDEEEILTYLKDSFDIEWTTFAQVNFRLLWLMNLDKIVKIDVGYKAK